MKRGDQSVAKTVIMLVFMSLVVGLVLSFFGVTPANFWESMGGFAVRAWDTGTAFFDWALFYILIGGAVVVPVYLLRLLMKAGGKKPDNPSGEGQE